MVRAQRVDRDEDDVRTLVAAPSRRDARRRERDDEIACSTFGLHPDRELGLPAGAGEIVVSAETLEGLAGSLRLSEPRTEPLKGVEEPVEVVSIDWR